MGTDQTQKVEEQEDDISRIARWIQQWADPQGDDAALAAELGINDPDKLWSPRPLAEAIIRLISLKRT